MSAERDERGIKLSIILPRWALTAIEQRAKRKGLAPSVLIRMIVLDWVHNEEKGQDR